MSWICLWKKDHVLKLKLLCLDLQQLSNPPIHSSNPFFFTAKSCDMEVNTSCLSSESWSCHGWDREMMHAKAVRDKRDVWYKPPGTLCLAVHWGPIKLGSIFSTAILQLWGCPCNSSALSQVLFYNRCWGTTVSRIKHSSCPSGVSIQTEGWVTNS